MQQSSAISSDTLRKFQSPQIVSHLLQKLCDEVVRNKKEKWFSFCANFFEGFKQLLRNDQLSDCWLLVFWIFHHRCWLNSIHYVVGLVHLLDTSQVTCNHDTFLGLLLGRRASWGGRLQWICFVLRLRKCFSCSDSILSRIDLHFFSRYFQL